MVSSSNTLKSVNPRPAWTPSKKGTTLPLKRSHVSCTFCSNSSLEEILEELDPEEKAQKERLEKRKFESKLERKKRYSPNLDWD